MPETLTKPNTENSGKVTYQDLKREAAGPVAKFFSNGTLKAMPPDSNPDGKPRMRFVVSTTTIDLVGDIMSEAFIDKMLAQAIGKTFFVNHSYIIPQDVLGKVESGRKFTEKMTDPVTGETGTYLLLEFVVLVAMSNPVAVKTYELVKEDEIKLGASVSIIILATTAGKNGTSIIQDGYYLETSAVGIPANQASWVQSIQKAFKEWERTGKSTPAHEEIIGTQDGNSIADSGAEKEVKQMTKVTPEPQITSKNAFDDVMAFDAQMTCYDLSYSLCDEISRLLIQADGGNMPGAEMVLDQLLADFSVAVKSLVAPALAALGEQAESAEVVEMSGENQGDTKIIAPNMEQAKAYFTWQEKNAPPVTNKESDTKPYQDMHDYLISKGATCKDMDTDDTADKNINTEQAQALSKAFEVKTTLEKEIIDLKTELATANTRSKQWEAISEKLKGKLQDYLKQPLSI